MRHSRLKRTSVCLSATADLQTSTISGFLVSVPFALNLPAGFGIVEGRQ